MAIIVPQPGNDISAETFGAPVANEVNRLTTLTAPTPWVLATLQNGFTHDIYSRQVYYRKIDDIVYWRGIANGSALDVTITTAPVGFRPAHGGIFVFGATTAGQIGQLAFGPDGTFKMLGGITTSAVSFECLQYSITL